MCEACPEMIDHNAPSRKIEDDVVTLRAALDYHPRLGTTGYRKALEALDRLAELAHRYEGVSK